MQNRPDKDVLLMAVAKFLDEDVRAQIKDPALAFRVRIASNLAKIVAVETKVEDAHDAAEFAGLCDLLTEASGQLPEIEGSSDRREAIRTLNAELAKQIRAGELDDLLMTDVLEHTKRTLIHKLSVTNPRFVTKSEIE